MVGASAPFVSVVTPFFDSEPYLAQCIESVLGQTYENFEYVLVDNQSKDRGPTIASEYAKRDPRIRLLRTERFLSQVQNYNFALGCISPDSRWCKMIQADDWLFPRCLEDMIPAGEASSAVKIVGAYRLVETAVDCTGVPPSTTVLAGREACRLHLSGKAFLFGSPSNVLYRADIVRARRPFFAEGRLHEDTEAVFEILRDGDLGFVHQVLTFTRRQSDSLMVGAADFLRDALDQYILVKKYGREYLAPEEYDACIEKVTAWYYFGLADHWLSERFKPRQDAFWEYQERGLSTIGETMQSSLLAKCAADIVLRKALSPLDLVRGMKRRLESR